MTLNCPGLLELAVVNTTPGVIVISDWKLRPFCLLRYIPARDEFSFVTKRDGASRGKQTQLTAEIKRRIALYNGGAKGEMFTPAGMTELRGYVVERVIFHPAA